MDFFQEFPLCCQDTEAVETIFRPPIDTGGSDREGIPHGKQIMEKPWRPPLYRDKSLLVGTSDVEDEIPPPKIITPSIGIVSCDDSIPSRQHEPSHDSSKNRKIEDISLPPAFVPPKPPFQRHRHPSTELEAFVGQEKEIHSVPATDEEDPPAISKSSSSTSHLKLGPKDVVCGRGAPTSIHPGNLAFKKTIKKHEMMYLCSTRSEKPKVATKLLEEFAAQGVRFLKREREDGGFVWKEIGEQRAYEKICQSLREGAPQLRRKMMSSEALRSKNKNISKKREQQGGHTTNHNHPQKQQRQDSDTAFSDSDNRRIVYDVSKSHSSSFSTVQTTNVDNSKQVECRDPIGEQNHFNIEWLYYDDRARNHHHLYDSRWYYEDGGNYHYEGGRHHHYEVGRHHNYDDGRHHYDVPYFVHLPPQLGGERLFRDRVE